MRTYALNIKARRLYRADLSESRRNRLAKKASNNFKVAKDAVTSTGLKFSVTGHGVGGAVAALAALEMGAVANEPKV